MDDKNQAIGGNKFVLFNAEYYFDVAGPLRLLLFYDAGQAFAEGQNINLRQLRTSTGAELRFIMPVLNVPFRLIYAFNLEPRRIPARADVQVRGGHDVLTEDSKCCEAERCRLVLLAASLTWACQSPTSTTPTHRFHRGRGQPQPGHGRRPHRALLHVRGHQQPAQRADGNTTGGRTSTSR